MLPHRTFSFQQMYFRSSTMHGGREMAQYPLTIYEKWVRVFFTFVIPFGCVNYLPLMYVPGRAEGSALLYMLTPLGGALFLAPCLWAWHKGVRRYRSTGS